MNWLKRLFRLNKTEYQPVSQWLLQGENGYHNGDWSRR